MSYRISTSGMHDAAIAQMLAQQTRLSQTQSQIASGKRVQNPADDPVAATQIMGMQQTRDQLAQYAKNSEAVTNRLNVGEQSLADASSLLQRVRDLAVQANSAALDATARGSIATELKSRVQELQDLANRRDANGEYLFAGMSSQTQPFSRGAGGVTYAGDQGVRAIQVSADQRITDGFSGQQVFLDIPQGNGTFTVTQGVHTGTGSIDTGVVTNAAAWVPGNYTLQFTSASAWQVVDATNTVVASGAYTSGSAIPFNGAEVTVTGAPAAGDTYAIAPAGKQDVFTTLDQLINTLGTGVDNPASRSTLTTNIGRSLTQIDQALNHTINLRAELGTRLSAVDNATTTRQQLDDTLAGSVGKLQDLDYATAVSSMNQQLLGLQAAQQAYSRIAELSLFKYL
jgi:flagellar hook-associated protein 3 FlgL